VGQVGDLDDPAAHHPRRVHHEVLGIEAPHHHVAPHLRAAGEHDAADAFVRGERVFGIFQLEDIPGHQLAFAGAAVAGLAAVGEADTLSQQCAEHGFTFLGGRGLVQIGNGNGKAHRG
jgi:hypothetical protein